MTFLFPVILTLWLAKGAFEVLFGLFQILAGIAIGLCGALLMGLALPVQAMEFLWQTAFPKN